MPHEEEYDNDNYESIDETSPSRYKPNPSPNLGVSSD